MKVEQTHIDQIRSAFEKMQSKEDLLQLLNEAKPLVYGDKAVPFKLKQLTWYANPKLGRKRYAEFKIKKKSGAERSIHAPVRGLKSLQKTLSFVLQCVFEPHKAAMGFVWGKSIVDNAMIHEGNNYVYNIDLKDFFPSIDQARVWKCFQLKPFNLTRESSVECLVNQIPSTTRLDIANIIASLCCTEMEVERKNEDGKWETVKRKVLPQGAPTSPVISNIVCQRLDYILTGVAKRFGLKYSRYADDITFSSLHNVYQPESAFQKELHRIIAEQGFHIKESKTRLQKDGYRKEVTGLLVNEKANVQQRYIKQLRMWLYYWERYGYERAYGFFLQQYIADKRHVKKGKTDMANVIAGKLDYLKMVKGVENELYLKLNGRFDDLLKVNNKIFIEIKSNSIENLLYLNKSDEIKTLVDGDPKNLAGKIRININSLDSAKGQVKLKRKIIIDKGENLPLEEFIENYEKEEKEIDLSKHKPIDVSKFLKYFQNGKLKWLTHKYEEGPYDRIKIIQEAKVEFTSLTRSLIIQPALYKRVNWYGFDPEQEGFYFLNKSHYTNWQSPNVIKWEKENPNMHPINSDLLFLELFDPFKKSIELKKDDMKNIISNQLVSSLGSLFTSFELEFIDTENVNLYTDVDAFKRGMSYIFNAIKQRHENGKKIKFIYRKVSDNEGRKRILEIIHVNSKCNRNLDKSELFKGDLLEAEKAFFGICDWSIISRSPDNSVNKLNILFDIRSNKTPKEKIDDSLIEGFTHVLTFYS